MNVLIVGLETEDKWCREAASLIERIRQQPTGITIGAPKRRVLASPSILGLMLCIIERVNPTRGLCMVGISYSK